MAKLPCALPIVEGWTTRDIEVLASELVSTVVIRLLVLRVAAVVEDERTESVITEVLIDLLVLELAEPTDEVESEEGSV